MMKKKLIGLVVVVVLCLGLFGGSGLPVLAESSSVDVSSLDEFISALNSDVDVINLTGNFNIDRTVTLGDASKPKTVTRSEGGGLYVQWSDTDIVMFQSITFDGGGYSSPMIETNCETVFNDCTFKNCSDTSVKVWQNGFCTFERCIFKDNQQGNRGGQLSLLGSGTYTLTDCTFTGGKANKTGYADNEGGGIYIGHSSSNVTMTGCTITGNSSSGNGGGISNKGNLTVTDCLIYGNTCDGSGQDIHNEGTLTLNDSLEDLTTKLDALSLVSDGWFNEDTQSLQEVPDTFTGTMNLTLKTSTKEEEQPSQDDTGNTDNGSGTSSGTTGGTSSSPSTQTVTQSTGNTTINVTVPDTNGTQGTTTTNLPQSSQTPQNQGQTPQVVTVTTDKQKDDEGNVIVNNNITITVSDPEGIQSEGGQIASDSVPKSSSVELVNNGSESPTQGKSDTLEQGQNKDWTGTVTNVLLFGLIGFTIYDKIQQRRKRVN